MDSLGRCPKCSVARSDATPPTEMLAHTRAATDAVRVQPTDQFAPGTILAGRYRIVALLGRGGMGYVYRAEDMKLGQTVALKFLPPAKTDDARYLEIMLSEVRMARQVSSPYVCRVHDVVEEDGLRFLTMEYVDGENLAGLLKRIGRLPAERGQEIASQVCEGLAAAHAMGVLHRDLKPANLMIDGQGRPKITDFGLALDARDAGARSEVAGTPGYIAPEVAQGKAVSVQSDLYGLGAILYEIYTGHRAVDDGLTGKTANTPAPSSRVSAAFPKDVPKPVQQVILRCLEADPAKRPRSAKEVASAFPVHDPLALAEAAGETPSPEMVAAAGSDEPLALWKAWAFLLIIVASFATVRYTARTILPVAVSPFTIAPAQLPNAAHTLLRELGYADPPADEYSYFAENQAMVAEHIQRRDRGIRSPGDNDPEHGTGYEQGLSLFVYRESASGLLVANDPMTNADWSDPAIDRPGMINVEIDSRGHLIRFLAIPKHGAGVATNSGGEPNWSPAFAAAGLDVSKMQTVPPTIVPVTAFDWRHEWEGTLPGYPNVPVRVAATGFEGKLTSFRVMAPWNAPGAPKSSLQAPFLIGWSIVTGVGSFVVVFFAIRNLRRGRADAAGALRLGVAIFVMVLLNRLLRMRLVADVQVMNWRLLDFVASALLATLICAGAYLAIEPYLRRKMPRLLISWMQMLKGRWRSPRLGRDMLAGAVLASLQVPLGAAFVYWNFRSNSGLTFPVTGLELKAMYEPSFWMANLLGAVSTAVFLGLFVLALYFILRSVFRLRWLASLAMLTFFFFFGGGPPHYAQLSFILINLGIALMSTVCVLRFGLLATVVFNIWGQLIFSAPLTFDFSQWYTPAAMANLAVMVGLTIYAFWISIGDQRMFGNFKLDD